MLLSPIFIRVYEYKIIWSKKRYEDIGVNNGVSCILAKRHFFMAKVRFRLNKGLVEPDLKEAKKGNPEQSEQWSKGADPIHT